MSDRLRPLRLMGTPSPVKMPTDRASLAWLYGFCAWREGVTIERNAAGVPIAVRGPRLGCISYIERMRSLPAIAAPPPGKKPPRRKKGVRIG